MIETMEAVEIEKQKHNSTRMEAFARVARLEVLVLAIFFEMTYHFCFISAQSLVFLSASFDLIIRVGFSFYEYWK